MKTVFENRMVAHVWAQQNQSEGRSSNRQFYFRDRTIFSYRDSWPLATFIGENEVLLNTQRVSITTSKHLGYVQQALKSDVKIWHVDCNIIKNPDDFLKLSPKKREKFLADKSAKKAASDKAYKNQMAKEARARRKEKTAADNQTLEQLLTKWRNREDLNRYEHDAIKQKWREENPGERQTDFIRFKDAGTLETNRGATVPTTHAMKVWKYLKNINRKTLVNSPINIGMKIGHFKIDQVNESGINAGCHFINWQELELTGKLL